jgi:hypothetical protein
LDSQKQKTQRLNQQKVEMTGIFNLTKDTEGLIEAEKAQTSALQTEVKEL